MNRYHRVGCFGIGPLDAMDTMDVNGVWLARLGMNTEVRGEYTRVNTEMMRYGYVKQ